MNTLLNLDSGFIELFFPRQKPKQPTKLTYWHIEALAGKNRVIGRVKAESRAGAIREGLRATHDKYPNSLIIVLGGKCRPIV